jgi:hypothetical protein
MSRRSRESPIIAVEAQFISLTPSVQSSAHTDVCQLPSLDFCQAPGQTVLLDFSLLRDYTLFISSD